jgi:hypothetical protein
MNVQDLESRFNNIQKSYELGSISHQEYVTLMKGLNLESAIKSGAKELQKKQELYEAITKAVAVVKVFS